MKKTPGPWLCVWFTCSGVVMKAVKGNWQEKCGYFLSLNLLLCQRKITVNVTALCNVLPLKDNFLFPHMTSFKHRSRFVWKYINSVDICGWSRVSVTWLQSKSDSGTDHPVVFPRPWLQSNQFYVVCGQQTAFDLREWQAYPLCEFWGQGWERQTASSDWVTLGLSSITYSSLVLLNYLIGVHSIPRTEI